MPEPPVAAPDHARYEIGLLIGPCSADEAEAMMVQIVDLPEAGRLGGVASLSPWTEEDELSRAELDDLTAELQQDKERIERADRELESIIIRCEEGDRKADWLPTIARLARSARAVLAGAGDATATVKPGDVCPACGNRRGVANPTTYACTECWNALQVAAGAGDATP